LFRKWGFVMITYMKKNLLLNLLLLISCSTADERSQKQRMKNNLSCEKIYRLSSEKNYHIDSLELATRQLYPWENETKYPKITINTLRCRGSKDATPIKSGDKIFEDCGGLHDHGLPYQDGEEFIYPALITLLNRVQNSFDKKVVVTSGHRCPKHHNYLVKGQSKISRYMMGCKADFTVEGLENRPEEIIVKIMDLYPNEKFQKINQADGSTLYTSKQFHLMINKEGEHSILGEKHHPVVSVDVRYDQDKQEAIILDWDKSFHGFIRH
jgi:hypothetical protein